MTCEKLEEEIVAAGADVAPRITPADIEQNIVFTGYFNAGDATGVTWSGGPHASLHLLTICVLVLKNGFTVTGESACASLENYNWDIGKRVARQNAVSKIWPLMGYALKQRLHDAA
jgi:Phage protein (N4 Gp49/phage Sf6 gene 66) family